MGSCFLPKRRKARSHVSTWASLESTNVPSRSKKQWWQSVIKLIELIQLFVSARSYSFEPILRSRIAISVLEANPSGPIDLYFFFALPPLRPPLRELAWVDFFPRPLPLFLPPLSCLLTVAQARRSASFLDVPRFS